MLARHNGMIALGGSRAVFDPRFLFAAGEKGVILLPENSDVAVGNGVGTVTDVSGNGKNATQGTALSQPILRQNATTGALYWEFDGSNDFLSTAAIDFTGTSKITCFIALRKTSDAIAGWPLNLNSTAAGSFSIRAPSTNAVADIVGTATGTGGTASSTAASTAPASAVVILEVDMSAPTLTMTVNGVAGTTVTSPTGGAFSNAALHIGQRSIGASRFTGHIYGAIVLGRLCAATEKVAAQAFLNRRIGAF